MRPEDVTLPLGLEEKHFRLNLVSLPIIESSLYTTLGRRIFECYEKYKISADDQRELERLSFLVMAFTLERDSKKSGLWFRWWKQIRGALRKI